MQWEVVIGLETHVQLSTVSKIFSGASTHFGAEPNTQACPVDLALPGVLPVMNRGAVEKAIQFGLAIGAHVAPLSVFARKNYFYPDLPKGYQISQFEKPVVQGGKINCVVEQKGKDSYIKTVNLTRAHLEEDAGKSLHEEFADMTGIDLNRAGTPLLEIVTEPDMRSAAEAVAYAKALHSLVTWLGMSDGNMQEGSFRCDANVSVRPAGSDVLGTRCEVKNLNSFRNLEEAINYEVERQIELIESGGQVASTTRTNAKPVKCAPRKTPTTTAISRIPICRRWSFRRNGSNESKAPCPNCRTPCASVSSPTTACRNTMRLC